MKIIILLLSFLFVLINAQKNGGIAVKNELSYYCGDAAGRPVCVESKKKKKDFAASDRLLAMNVGLAFYTPEEHFLNHKPLPYILPTFNPTSITSSMTGLSITDRSSERDIGR